MGFDQQIIIEQLLEDIQLWPFEFFIEQFRIAVVEIDLSKNKEWNYIGTGYQLSLFIKLKERNFYIFKILQKKNIFYQFMKILKSIKLSMKKIQ
jgi:hypothetical protein